MAGPDHLLENLQQIIRDAEIFEQKYINLPAFNTETGMSFRVIIQIDLGTDDWQLSLIVGSIVLSFKFHNILTDIGDNQSIENELSTYSYRLQRMKHFLDVANKRTLLLLDEFGTGSDPELGGALAEVFFEKLYY